MAGSIAHSDRAARARAVRWWEEALGAWLSWTQNPNYRRQPPHPAFLDNYGYAVIAGPEDGPPALARAPGLEGPWRREPPGTAIYHAPGVVHATRAGNAPLLAIYAWCGDLATHARLARS